jgi:TrmH family RNA methyltransferase
MHDADNVRRFRIHELLSTVRLVQRHRTVRDARGLFWIEGVRQFVQGVEGGFEFETIVHCPVLLRNSLAEKLVRKMAAAEGSCRLRRVTPEAFRSVCLAEQASGIGALVRQRWTPLSRASPYRGLCWLAIEGLRSRGNLGTILRTAEATGVAGVIFLSAACDPFDPAVIRASMGGAFHLHMVRCASGPAELRAWADAHGAKVVGLSPRAGQLWTAVRADEPLVLLLGEERQGLSAAARGLCDLEVRLPMIGRADSLNVGVAAGVMMYELVRQACGGRGRQQGSERVTASTNPHPGPPPEYRGRGQGSNSGTSP